MRKRIIHVLNWDKYQARSDKELPWCKLWGRLFRTPWFQLLDDPEKFCTIAILDLARQFSNRISEELLYKGYLRGNYGVFISEERIFKLCKVLCDNEFLSDNCPTFVEVEGDKKDKKEKKPAANPISFLESLKSNPAYKVIDIDRELSKMDAWLLLPKNKNRQKTPRFILNWLNKIERPLVVELPKRKEEPTGKRTLDDETYKRVMELKKECK